MSAAVKEGFKGWAVLELMGHRQLAGYVQEVEIAGGKMLRVDVYPPNGQNWSQLYGSGAIYCISPVTEEVARKILEQSTPEPPFAWAVNRAYVDERVDYELTRRLPRPTDGAEPGPENDDDRPF